MSDPEENAVASVTDAPVAAVDTYTGPPTPSSLELESQAFKDKMEYISLQIELLKPAEKTKFTNDFKVVGKSLNALRKVLKNKESDTPKEWEINYEFFGCVLLMVLIFG